MLSVFFYYFFFWSNTSRCSCTYTHTPHYYTLESFCPRPAMYLNSSRSPRKGDGVPAPQSIECTHRNEKEHISIGITLWSQSDLSLNNCAFSRMHKGSMLYLLHYLLKHTSRCFHLVFPIVLVVLCRVEKIHISRWWEKGLVVMLYFEL